METILTFIIVTVSILGLAATIFAISYSVVAKRREFVLQNSIGIRKLVEINNKYKFYDVSDCDESHTYDNEKLFDTISCEDYLIYQLQFKKKSITENIQRANSNRDLYLNYLADIKTNVHKGQFSAPCDKFRQKQLLACEEKLIADRILPRPTTQFRLKVILKCSRLDGDVYRRKSDTFEDQQVLTLIKRINKRTGYYYNDRGIWDAICRVERGRVSNKMRFAIYKRDGYKCRMCGASGNETDLEVDHIIPISKGGKSTYDNLQTLCHNCNKEKSNKIY